MNLHTWSIHKTRKQAMNEKLILNRMGALAWVVKDDGYWHVMREG